MQLSELFTFTTILILAVISPGPDFAIVVKNTLSYSRRSGILTAFGISLGLTVHVLYTLVGIGIIIANSILLFNVLKYLGAAYIFYIGFKSLMVKPHQTTIDDFKHNKKDISTSKSIQNGFFTNALNPKASLFFLGVFTQIIKPSTLISIRMFYCLESLLIVFLWFAFVAVILSHSFIRKRIGNIQLYSEKIMGIVLIIFGIGVAISKR